MKVNKLYWFFVGVVLFLLVIHITDEVSVNALTDFDPLRVGFRETVTGLTQPIFLAHASDGSGRLFIVERTGRIRVFQKGELAPTPFLDLQSIVNASSSEQGLLALAFHPNYETNGQFYTVHTDENGSLVLSRLVRSASNPDLANPGSRTTLLVIPHPTYQNHNGGTLAFGPDGYLYWSTGDGGGGGDPFNNAQSLNSLLGKILRLDVDHTDPGLMYSIPPDNPFYNLPNRRLEIWAYGLRNPWRFSFDRQTGDMFIGDVGQGLREEIDFQPAGSAGSENYGWRVMEGTTCYNPSTGCDPSGKILPISEYDHSLGCSVTGGYIYRGTLFPSLQGHYFYGDFCSGIVFSLYNDPTSGWTAMQVADTPYFITSFGEDEQGELYVTDYSAGKIYQICYGLPVDVAIAGTTPGQFHVCQNQSSFQSYAGVDSGPVKITSADDTPIIASERINLPNHPAVSSYTEFLGLPATQVTDTYLFPWYNNASLDSQLRIANVGNVATTVNVKIGTLVDENVPLGINESKRLKYNVDTGPVVVTSVNNVPIIASERINLPNHPVVSSYTEFIGLLGSNTPGTRYLFPWYNNVSLDAQLRFANVGSAPTTVTVKIGTAVNDSFTLGANQSLRKTYAADTGPVEVISSGGVPIIASERVNLLNHPLISSYAEFIGLPGTTVTHTKYLFPWYNNVSLDSQLRVANVGSGPTTVMVRIGTQVNDSFALDANQSVRKTYNADTGPLIIESTGGQPIIASQRVNLLNHPAVSSYSEFIGLSVGDPLGWPGNQLSDTYWFPWYNNVGLDSQLRFGVP